MGIQSENTPSRTQEGSPDASPQNHPSHAELISARQGAAVAVVESPATAVAEFPRPAAAATWDQPTAEKIWRETLLGLESMTETFARVVAKVRADGDQTLWLVFPADASLAMERCKLPEHKSALTDAVSLLAGRQIILEFESAAPAAQPAAPEATASKPSRLQRMREIEANALVKSCVELFDAEIVRIDKPK